ncbi:MAG: hypothetical protein M9924_11390 [Rhizobiaceae bacterium]|nr:hypothetical protein [Rhizobiaceae bacterium]
MTEELVREVVPDRLFVLGGSISAERPFSLFPRGFAGFIPINCYVLISQDELMLIDTGITLHFERILQAVNALKAKYAIGRVKIILTRREPDVLINMGPLVDALSAEQVYCGGVLDPFEFFDLFENTVAQAVASGVSKRPLIWMAAGHTAAVGELKLEVLRISLRVLTTFWLYERSTRTLFSSDTFAFLTQPEPGPAKAYTNGSSITVDLAKTYLDEKFNWLQATDTEPLVRDLDAIAQTYEIERLCPSLGSWIEGREAVDAAFAAVREALRLEAKEPYRSRLQGLNLAALCAQN